MGAAYHEKVLRGANRLSDALDLLANGKPEFTSAPITGRPKAENPPLMTTQTELSPAERARQLRAEQVLIQLWQLCHSLISVVSEEDREAILSEWQKVPHNQRRAMMIEARRFLDLLDQAAK